jgi:hypothetical protein
MILQTEYWAKNTVYCDVMLHCLVDVCQHFEGY